MLALRSSSLDWRWLGCVVVACATLAASGAPTARADDRVRVALLPLVIRASDGRDYLQRGLADMLVSRLGRERRLAVIPVDDPGAATVDGEAARGVGKANGAAYVVFGSFTHLADGASLDLACAVVDEPDREPRRIYVRAESMASMIPLLEGVAERLAIIMVGPATAPADATAPAQQAAPPSEAQDRDDGRVR